MSPSLFNIYIADLDKVFVKRNIGGIMISDTRVQFLAYADDMVLVVKNKIALEDMMDTMKGFLKIRKMELSTEKTKILVFNREKKRGKDKQKWRNKEIEEVKKFKYLGFTFNHKGNYKNHIKELSRKERITANKIWGIGEKNV